MMCEQLNKSVVCVIGIASLTLAMTMGCTSSKPPLEYIGPNMVKSPAVKAQRADCTPNGSDCTRAMRIPPKGSLPTHYTAYPYPEDPEMAGRMLKNPLRPTKEVLLKGQKLYGTFCAVCHGDLGDGSGYIVPKFPQPPSLFSEKVNAWSDGRIFHVLTQGQNLMPSYASQISADERWAIIHYVRALQKAAGGGK